MVLFKHKHKTFLFCSLQNVDEDSEAEKLSPLLNKSNSHRNNNLALNMEDVAEPIDDGDTYQDEQLTAPEKSKMYSKMIF